MSNYYKKTWKMSQLFLIICSWKRSSSVWLRRTRLPWFALSCCTFCMNWAKMITSSVFASTGRSCGMRFLSATTILRTTQSSPWFLWESQKMWVVDKLFIIDAGSLWNAFFSLSAKQSHTCTHKFQFGILCFSLDADGNQIWNAKHGLWLQFPRSDGQC